MKRTPFGSSSEQAGAPKLSLRKKLCSIFVVTGVAGGCPKPSSRPPENALPERLKSHLADWTVFDASAA